MSWRDSLAHIPRLVLTLALAACVMLGPVVATLQVLRGQDGVPLVSFARYMPESIVGFLGAWGTWTLVSIAMLLAFCLAGGRLYLGRRVDKEFAGVASRSEFRSIVLHPDVATIVMETESRDLRMIVARRPSEFSRVLSTLRESDCPGKVELCAPLVVPFVTVNWYWAGILAAPERASSTKLAVATVLHLFLLPAFVAFIVGIAILTGTEAPTGSRDALTMAILAFGFVFTMRLCDLWWNFVRLAPNFWINPRGRRSTARSFTTLGAEMLDSSAPPMWPALLLCSWFKDEESRSPAE